MSLGNVKNIVLVLSGKGGVGKSSVTTQLALSLSLAGHSVGILDIDLTGPSIPRLLGIESAKITQAPGGWLPVEVHPSQILAAPPAPTIVPSQVTAANGTGNSDIGEGGTHDDSARAEATTIGSLHAMSLAFLLADRSSAIVWRGPKKTAMVRQFLSSVLWPETDYLLIDTPPGTSDEHISLVETLLQDLPPSTLPSPHKSHLAGAVIVTTPQAVSISDVRKELNFCAKTGVKVIGVVENMSGYVCECCGVATNLFSKGGGEVMARDFGVRFLGGVPVDAQWGALVEEGSVCVYGGVVGNGEEDESDEDDGAMEGSSGEEKERDPRSLVDRYRTCSLCPLFEAFAKQLVETVRAGTAATPVSVL